MADVITRFKLETTQYDSKLRDAAKGISSITRQAELAGQGFNNFSQKSIEAARALGQTASGATNAKDKVRDLVGAYNEAAKAYNKLTQEQQQSDFGKALAQSLTQLKGRITEAKQELYSIGDSTKSTGGIMDQLASKLAVNIDAFKLLNVGVSAAKVALDVAKSAFMANEAAVDEWGRTMQSAQGLYEGFLNALNTGDISGYLSRMDEIMRAARAAYDELDKLGTMKTIQAPKISAQQTENERMRMMIQTGRYIAPIDGRKASMQNGQLLTPEQIKRIETQLQNGLKTVTSLVGNEVKQSGKAIDAYYNSLAKQNGMSLQEFRKGTSSWEEFSKKLAGFDAYKEWDKNARTEFARQGGRGNVDFDKNNPYADFKKWGVFRVDKQGENSLNDLVKLIQQRDQQTSQAYSTLSQSYRAINRAEGITVKGIMNGGGGGKGGTSTVDKEAEQTARMLAELRKQEAKATKEIADARAREHQTETKGLSGFNEQTISAWTAMMKDQLSKADFGSVVYNSIEENMRDMTTITDLTKEALKRGLDPQSLGLTELFETAFDNIDVPDSTLKAIVEKINAAMKDGLKLEINSESGKVTEKKTEKKRDTLDDTKKIVGGLSQVAGGLQQMGVELPDGVQKVMGVVQGVMSVIEGVQTIISLTQTPAIIANTVAMGALTTAMTANTVSNFIPFFAHGGMVPTFANGGLIGKAAGGMLIPGNSFSGDNLRMPVDGGRGFIGVNSGELILNRSQQANLASQLQGSGGQTVRVVGKLSGESLFLCAENWAKRTGKGEFVMWR